LGLSWRWDEALYGRLLRVVGGKERLRFYIERYHPGGTASETIDAFVNELHAVKTRHFETLGASLPLRTGVVRLVSEARAAEMRLAVATTAARAATHAVLDAHPEFAGAFDVIVCGEDVAEKKTAPDVYVNALALIRCDASHSVAIEDSQTGLQAADRWTSDGRDGEPIYRRRGLPRRGVCARQLGRARPPRASPRRSGAAARVRGPAVSRNAPRALTYDRRSSARARYTWPEAGASRGV
jgi:HAD superfamily hydrolase (TIGR01509 family)